MTGSDHDRYADAPAAYLLGALPELEASAFERHVMGCSACRDEVERLRHAAEALPRSVRPLSPPTGLKRSLLGVVKAEADQARGSGWMRAWRRLRAPSLPRIRPAVALASAAFLVALGVGGGLGAATLLQRDEGTRTFAAEIDKDRLAEGSASLIVPDERSERAVLSVNGLPPMPARGKTNVVYQLWLVRGNEVMPSSVFIVSANGSGGAAVTGDLETADAVWVTRERAGGARAPTESPVMRIDLS